MPSWLGILVTSWEFGAPLVAAGLATMAAIVYLLVATRRARLSAARLAGAAGFYLAFLGLLRVL